MIKKTFAVVCVFFNRTEEFSIYFSRGKDEREALLNNLVNDEEIQKWEVPDEWDFDTLVRELESKLSIKVKVLEVPDENGNVVAFHNYEEGSDIVMGFYPIMNWVNAVHRAFRDWSVDIDIEGIDDVDGIINTCWSYSCDLSVEPVYQGPLDYVYEEE